VGSVQGKEMKRERNAILVGQEERKKNVRGRRKKAKRNVMEDVSREQKKARHDVELAER